MPRKKDPPPLPDVSQWQPRTTAAESLSTAFMKRCLASEKRILLRVRHEREMAVDNYDAGLGIEDIVRDELAQILPSRYTTKAGVLNDSLGQTGGDYDILIFNSQWVPEIKCGAINTSRRIHLPIEGVYAVGEIKQTLTYKSLDKALEKLVVAHRLYRPPTSASRIAENRELSSCRCGLTNPLYSFIIATQLGNELSFDDVVRRFTEINRGLRRPEVIRALCVLGIGTIQWVFHDDDDIIRPALFMGEDLRKVLHIGFEEAQKIPAFYSLLRSLSLHLFQSIIAPEDVASKYGYSNNDIKIACQENLSHDLFADTAYSEQLPWNCEWNFL